MSSSTYVDVATFLPRSEVRTNRIAWLDAAKGIGILFVIAGHALGGVIDSSLSFGAVPVRQMFLGIYLFHMPLFFMLAGLLVEPRIRRGSGRFMRSLLTSLVVPYFLWGIIQVSVIHALGGLVNHPLSTAEFLRGLLEIVVRPPSQFWFLYALLIMHFIALAVLPRMRPISFLVFAFVLRSMFEMGVIPGIAGAALRFLPFYAIGVVLGTDGLADLVMRHRPVVKLWALGVAGALLAAVTMRVVIMNIGPAVFFGESPRVNSGFLSNEAWNFNDFAAAIVLSALVIGASARVGGGAGAVLSYLGRLSFPIYILHILCLAGFRIVLVRFFHVEDVLVILPGVIAAGLAGPLVILAVLDRLRLTRFVGLA